MPDRPLSIDDLAARAAIFDCIARYMRGQDRLDAALQKSSFHPDATVDYGFHAGPAHAFVDFAQALLANYAGTWHSLGQSLIEVDGDRAVGEVYFHAWHRRKTGEGPQDLQIAGRYLDRYACRNGVWAIVYREEIIDWTRTDPAADDWFDRTPTALRGQRGGADRSQMEQFPHGPA